MVLPSLINSDSASPLCANFFPGGSQLNALKTWRGFDARRLYQREEVVPRRGALFPRAGVSMSAMSSKWPKVIPPAFRTFDLEIDTELERVKRASRVIALTAREYELLLLLALNRGHVVTRSEILAHFYRDDPDASGQSNLVDVYIRFLRQKLDDGFWPRLILTRRGQGYLLRAGMGAQASRERTPRVPKRGG